MYNTFISYPRMGHSWIPRDMAIFNKRLRNELRLRTDVTYNDPNLTYVEGTPNGMEGLAYWLSGENCPETDA